MPRTKLNPNISSNQRQIKSQADKDGEMLTNLALASVEDNNNFIVKSLRILPTSAIDTTPKYIEAFLVSMEFNYPMLDTCTVLHQLLPLNDKIYDFENKRILFENETEFRRQVYDTDIECEELSDELQALYQTHKYQKFAQEIVWRQQELSASKFAAHNYLKNVFNLPIARILKMQIRGARIFCSYMFTNGTKGATILSKKVCNPVAMLQKRSLNLGIIDGTSKANMRPIKHYKIQRFPDGDFMGSSRELLCHVTANHNFSIPGYVRIDSQITGEVPFEIIANDRYEPCNCQYDALFNCENVVMQLQDVLTEFLKTKLNVIGEIDPLRITALACNWVKSCIAQRQGVYLDWVNNPKTFFQRFVDDKWLPAHVLPFRKNATLKCMYKENKLKQSTTLAA